MQIPRTEIDAIAIEHHGITADLDFDPTIEWVREVAATLRDAGGAAAEEADDLDALADRYANRQEMGN